MRSKTSLFLLFIFIIIFSQFLYSLRGILTSTPIDFLHYYLSSEGLLKGQNPYVFVPLHQLADGQTILFNYPPTALLIFWPLALIPVEISRLLWEMVILISLILTVKYSFKILNLKSTNTLLFIIFSLLFLSFPLRHTFGMGQVSILIGFFLVFSFYLFLKENKHSQLFGSFFLALAISLKGFPIIFLLYYLLKKRLRICLYTLFFLLLFMIISYLLVGIKGWEIFLKVSPKPDYLLTRGSYYEQSISAFFARLNLNFSIKFLLFIITSAYFYLLVLVKIIREKNKFLNPIHLSLFFCLITFNMGFNWQHYFALLIFPFIVIGKNLILKKDFQLILFIISYLLLSVNLKNPQIYFSSYYPMGLLILSHGLIGALILYFLIIKNE